MALVRAWIAAAPPTDPWEAGTPIALDIEELSGDDFRLLPGVGPVLAERLETARQEAARSRPGGRLTPAELERVPGVGPSLLRRWAALRTR